MSIVIKGMDMPEGNSTKNLLIYSDGRVFTGHKDDANYFAEELVSTQDEKKGETMSEIVREMTREELVAFNNELRAENEKLKAELQEARLAVEHNRHVAETNQLKYELHYKDGVIYGMKYALKCNGVSGGEIDKI